MVGVIVVWMVLLLSVTVEDAVGAGGWLLLKRVGRGDGRADGGVVDDDGRE